MNIFRKGIQPACEYCEHGTRISPEEVACIKRGVVTPWESCGRFKYCPLKRIPDRHPTFLRLLSDEGPDL